MSVRLRFNLGPGFAAGAVVPCAGTLGGLYVVRGTNGEVARLAEHAVEVVVGA